ncbi:hypothetical protein DAEQUDRAFT_219300 [Daedalea quercina L-15889]|uniref:Uncharacterized protein n=1 Tax=Daedalea quercina L-15889 TaxID=1314783 RepID=A0A165R688_9APHY|nr:hypothetical protein DAEQUDRAFT_219300 [Daedalea quercina L-15889]
MSNLSSSSSVTATPSNVNLNDHPGQQPPPPGKQSSRIPVTPAALRSIFASSRTTLEERSLSRVAFFRYASLLIDCSPSGLLTRWMTAGSPDFCSAASPSVCMLHAAER